MAQFSLVETAGRDVGRLIVVGVVLCIATPALALIPIIAVLEPPGGRPPASAWWLLVGGMAATVGVALLVWAIARLLRVVLAVRITPEDDLVLEGLFAATSITIGDITALAEGEGATPHPTLVIQHRYGTASVSGDADTLTRIASAIGERNPYVALGPWTQPLDSEAEPQGGEQCERDPAHFLFLGARRAGWTFQVIAVAVMALLTGVTIVEFGDKLNDALGGAQGLRWTRALAQVSGTLGTLVAIGAPLRAPVLAAVVYADGVVRFARLWSTLSISAGEIAAISEPERSRRPELLIKHAGGELRLPGERAELEGLVSELRALNPEVELGPWKHLFAEEATEAGD